MLLYNPSNYNFFKFYLYELYFNYIIGYAREGERGREISHFMVMIIL